MDKRVKKEGFTLVELLVAMFIMVLLISIINVSFYEPIQSKKRDTQRIADITHIRQALELYYWDHNFYPPSSSIISEASPSDAYDSALSELVPNYMPKLVHDPLTRQFIGNSLDQPYFGYRYAWSSFNSSEHGPQSYHLAAVLENNNLALDEARHCNSKVSSSGTSSCGSLPYQFGFDASINNNDKFYYDFIP